MKREAHAILILAKPGECWVCTCGRWCFAVNWTLDDEEVAAILRTEFEEHKRFEEIYG